MTTENNKKGSKRNWDVISNFPPLIEQNGRFTSLKFSQSKYKLEINVNLAENYFFQYLRISAG